MLPKFVLPASAALLALIACSKEDAGNAAAPAADPAVKITQAKPPAGGTWADVVNETADGYVMGNPNAKVKLIEIGSLSCPHCKKFEDEGAKALVDNYVKSGKVSWEFRTYLIHGPIDMAANIIARCNGAKTFFPMVQSFYDTQGTWMAKIEATPQDKLNELQSLPNEKLFGAIADLLGLKELAATNGVPSAKTSQCLADPAMIDQQVQISTDVTTQFPEFTGTPAFAINGTLQPKDVLSWDKLEPRLQAALK